MNTISLKKAEEQEVILLSCYFIDNYMPEANGEFVKVYLYLLRILAANAPFSLSLAADSFSCTETDILRALKYWARKDLLSLSFDESQQLTGVTLLSPSKPEPETVTNNSAQLKKEEIPSMSAPVTTAVSEISASEEKKGISVPSEHKVQITRQRREELSGIDDIQQLLYLAEQYLGKTLSASNIDKLLYFYDNLHFSADFIEYLIEHCVSKGHTSMRYIETVAFAWADKGITTIEQARKESSMYNQEYFSILKALGITNRNPVESEIRLMDTWRKTYAFTTDIITEACSRTILQTGQSSFQYTDRILTDWHKKGVKQLSDIEKLDLAHQRKKTGKIPQGKSTSGNRFNNFPQRDYNYSEYEKLLLNQDPK